MVTWCQPATVPASCQRPRAAVTPAVLDGGSLLGSMIVPAADRQARPEPQARDSATGRRRENCWSCGMFVWTRLDTSYTCENCDVRREPLGDPELRARSQARELESQMREYDIDGWLDHGDPAQRRPAPALALALGHFLLLSDRWPLLPGGRTSQGSRTIRPGMPPAALALNASAPRASG